VDPLCFSYSINSYLSSPHPTKKKKKKKEKEKKRKEELTLSFFVFGEEELTLSFLFFFSNYKDMRGVTNCDYFTWVLA
jgi:hypothetical protein